MQFVRPVATKLIGVTVATVTLGVLEMVPKLQMWRHVKVPLLLVVVNGIGTRKAVAILLKAATATLPVATAIK
jgi:hypothetical protein